MELKKLVLKNFRGYENVTINFSSNINLIIGRNDVGKSTIMDALEVFLMEIVNHQSLKLKCLIVTFIQRIKQWKVQLSLN